MFISYDDIVEKLGEPIWYTESGYPRYCTFTPEECGIYHTAAALLEIACQSCRKRFRIGIPWTSFASKNLSKVFADAHERALKLIITGRDERYKPIYRPDAETVSVAELRLSLDLDALESTIIRPIAGNGGSFLFGDPPNHGCVGDTMSSYDLRILQYWERDRKDRGGNAVDWVRYPEHEVEIETED